MRRSRFHCLTLALALFAAPGAWAAPRVVVSIAPLHALVAGLMEGVAEPILWSPEGADLDAAPSDSQILELVTAELIICAGPGLETALNHTLEERLPAALGNRLILANHLPLLPRGDRAEAAPLDRQAGYDLHFWMDPRLAMMAVHHLTPKLVQLDPEHQERYLENEEHLMHRLMQLESEVAARIRDGGSTTDEGIAPYFAHRFLNGAAADAPASALAHVMPQDNDAYTLLLLGEADRATHGGQALAAASF